MGNKKKNKAMKAKQMVKKAKRVGDLFPTIKQLINAIEWWNGDRNVTYDEKSHTFKGEELIAKPSYDSGGGLDAIDFDVYENTYTFFMAYSMWEEMNNPKEDSPIIPPVMPDKPFERDDEELPF